LRIEDWGLWVEGAYGDVVGFVDAVNDAQTADV